MLKKLKTSVLSQTTNYREDDDHKLVENNDETLTFYSSFKRNKIKEPKYVKT